MVLTVVIRLPLNLGDFWLLPWKSASKQLVYLTKDEKYYFWGSVFDLTLDPDKDRSSKINLENVFMRVPKRLPSPGGYSDLECPNCQKAHSMVDEQLFKDFPNQIAYGV